MSPRPRHVSRATTRATPIGERYVVDDEAHSVTVTKHRTRPGAPTKGGSSLPDATLAQQSLSQDDGEEHR